MRLYRLALPNLVVADVVKMGDSRPPEALAWEQGCTKIDSVRSETTKGNAEAFTPRQ